MREQNQTEIKRILMYTSHCRAFRTTLIGYLYEISQVYPTVLLAEELDSETKKILQNKELFPKLEKIIPVHQHSGSKMNLLAKNRYLYKVARETIFTFKPDIVISGDTYLFESYLTRFAKRIKAVNISLQGGLQMAVMSEIAMWSHLTNVYLKIPSFLPLWLRMFLVKSKKYLAHFLYYWILPLLVGEKPLRGGVEFYLKKGQFWNESG